MIKGGTSMDFTNTLITTGAVLSANIIGGVLTVVGARLKISAEYRLKKEEVLRKKADDRIRCLYAPLLKLMSPPPPYDDFWLESDVCRKVINLIEKNELYASPDLLELFGEFRRLHYDDAKALDNPSKIGSDLYDKAYSEYEDLKNTLGYGVISKQSRAYVSPFRKIRSSLRSSLDTMKIRLWKMNRKRRKLLKTARK
jgi:hypothetical protein